MEKEIAFKTAEEISEAFGRMKELVNGELTESIEKFTQKGNKTDGKEARLFLMDISRDYVKPIRESIQYVKNNMPKK